MAAVEYEKCTSPHTSWFDRFQYTYFRPIWIGTPYVLKLRLVSTDSMDIGIRRCNHEAEEATAKSGVGPLWFKKWLMGEHYRPTTQGEVSIEAEIKNFLSPWMWKVFPRLAKLARRYSCITATSVPSERVFSAAVASFWTKIRRMDG